jgi:hypothetical protein
MAGWRAATRFQWSASSQKETLQSFGHEESVWSLNQPQQMERQVRNLKKKKKGSERGTVLRS